MSLVSRLITLRLKHKETETFMDKKYKYKENDIYKNKSASLWKILSNRYNTSDLRLFDEKETK